MGEVFKNIAEIFAKSGWAQIFFTEGGWKYAVMLAVACACCCIWPSSSSLSRCCCCPSASAC